MCGAVASQQPTYAVLSLIGDTMSVVGFRESSGSHLDRNIVSVAKVPDPVFDRAALLAVEDEFAAAIPRLLHPEAPPH